MSSRALRKLQREKDNHLNQHSGQDDDSDDGVVNRPSTKPSAFAILAGVEDDSSQDDEVSQTDDNDAGVKIDHSSLDGATITEASSSNKSSKKKKKKKKKAKLISSASSTNPAEVFGNEDSELDEIDRALKSLSTNGTSLNSGATLQGQDDALKMTNALLAVDTIHLHAQNEMKRLFGRAALENDEADDVPANVGGNRRQQRRVQQIGLAQALRGQGAVRGRSSGLAAIALKRNPFIQGKTEWPMATGGGLGMEIEEKRTDGTVLYRFVHNRAYQDVQAQFDSCVESMDPNRMVILLQHNPYHISTLLQVSEIAKQERDHTTSGDLLERALFSLGRAVHSTFIKNLTEGNARLDFARPENREFWLASWRYMQNLSMRGTWRTVYEWAKLLLSLSPQEDPYALWLVLDQYALRARQDLDFLNISRDANLRQVHSDTPAIQFSQSLAELRAGKKSKGQQALFTAVGRFPWFAARLMQELAIDPPPSVWGKQPNSEKERLLAELYALRAKDLWNTPENINVLTEIASALPPETPEAPVIATDISRAEARHVILSDVPALIALIPRAYTTAVQSTSDPLPPAEDKISYTNPHGVQTRSPRPTEDSRDGDLQELQGLHRFFSSIFPWFSQAYAQDSEAAEDLMADNLSEDAIQRAIRESGVPERELINRAQRMAVLRDRWVNSWTGADGEVVEGTEHPQHATVEDVSDNDES